MCREPLQIIQTGSYNFCRIAVHRPESAASTSHQQHANASLGQVNNSPQTYLVFRQHDSFQPQGATGVEHHRQLHAETASTTLPEEHAALQTAGPALVAVAGHDPAVLEIWNLQVPLLSFCKLLFVCCNDQPPDRLCSCMWGCRCIACIELAYVLLICTYPHI